MSVPSVTLTLVASLLIIGCATQEQQPIARAESASENHDERGWDKFRTWNRMGADHVNIASEERRNWVPPKEKGDQR